MTQFSTLTEMVDRTVSEILKGVSTSIPGHILSVDGQIAKIQVGVEFIGVSGASFPLDPIVNVPVHFPGGQFCLEYELNEGDEGVILVSQRCIDAWKEQGGVATQPILRKLDLQDALFIPGIRSKPNQLQSFANDGIRIRNEDASQYVWLKGGGACEVKCSDFNVISDTMTHNGVNVGDDHIHQQGPDSNGNTEQDTQGPQ